MFTTTHQGHWIPLTWLTLGANYALGGMNTWGYHLVNLVLHAASAVLFYFAARRLISAARQEYGEPALSAGAASAGGWATMTWSRPAARSSSEARWEACGSGTPAA